jgi:hypothetical protein
MQLILRLLGMYLPLKSSVSDKFVVTIMKSNGLVSGMVGTIWVGMFIRFKKF